MVNLSISTTCSLTYPNWHNRMVEFGYHALVMSVLTIVVRSEQNRKHEEAVDIVPYSLRSNLNMGKQLVLLQHPELLRYHAYLMDDLEGKRNA